jgi:hypothetical protein
MDNPGVYTLAALGITTALSAQAQTPIIDLDGMTAVTLEFAFAPGTGGSTASVTVQTSFDEGTTWRDIARADFTTAAAVKHCNLEGMLSKGMTAYNTLGSEGVYDGVLGDQLRAVVTSTGTYVGATLSARAAVR